MDSKLSLMDLPNETLNHILHHLLKEAKVNYGKAKTKSELLIDSYRCKALCITEVNKKFFDLAWTYLNTNCSFTYSYLPKNPHETMTHLHINQDGDIVELNEIVSFRHVKNLTLNPWQHECLTTTAKHTNPLLIRFPSLQQITLQHQVEFIIHIGRGQEPKSSCSSRTITGQGWWLRDDNEFLRMPSRHGLLLEVEKKLSIRVVLQIWEGHVHTVTMCEREVLSASYVDTALWKDLFSDMLDSLPEINCRDIHLSGGIRYAKWASTK